jgi:hypothetical protein
MSNVFHLTPAGHLALQEQREGRRSLLTARQVEFLDVLEKTTVENREAAITGIHLHQKRIAELTSMSLISDTLVTAEAGHKKATIDVDAAREKGIELARNRLKKRAEATQPTTAPEKKQTGIAGAIFATAENSNAIFINDVGDACVPKNLQKQLIKLTQVHSYLHLDGELDGLATYMGGTELAHQIAESLALTTKKLKQAGKSQHIIQEFESSLKTASMPMFHMYTDAIGRV